MREYSLKDLVTIKNGKDHKKLKDGEHPVYGSGGIMRYVDSYLYDKESVLLPRKGTLNNIQFVNVPFWTVDTCYYTEVNEALVLPYYLFCCLRNFDVESLNTGSAVPSMTFEKYYTIKVRIPEIEEQRKVAELLFSYDTLIELNNRKIKLIDEEVELVYQSWFKEFRYPGHENDFIENEKPNGWMVASVTDLLDVRYGKDHIPVFGSGGLMRKVKPILYSGESVLIPRKGSLNNILHVSGDFWTIDTMFYTAPKKENVVKYLYLFLRGLDMYSFNTGAAVPSMTINILDTIKVLLPPDNILEKFEKTVAPQFELIRVLQRQNDCLARERDAALLQLI